MLSEMPGVSKDDLRKMHSSWISWEELPGEPGMQTNVTSGTHGNKTTHIFFIGEYSQ